MHWTWQYGIFCYLSFSIHNISYLAQLARAWSMVNGQILIDVQLLKVLNTAGIVLHKNSFHKP